LNMSGLVMIGRYETTLPCTSQFPLTLPPKMLRNRPTLFKLVSSDSAALTTAVEAGRAKHWSGSKIRQKLRL